MGQAPQEFTVAGISGVSEEPWGDNNDMLTTEVMFAGDERVWKIHHNVAWPVAISQGSVLEGWKNFDKSTFGLSNKHKGDHAKSSKPKSGGGGGSGPGLSWKSAPYERGAEHPRNEARAIHTSAISAAPGYYELLRTEGVIPKAEDKASMLNTLAGIVTWLESGYLPVLDAVSAQALPVPPAAPQSASNGAPPPEVPADTEGLTPAPAGVSDDVPF